LVAMVTLSALREVAILKLRGYSNEEIANLRQRGLSTIERYLKMIREIWQDVDYCSLRLTAREHGTAVSRAGIGLRSCARSSL
jgi:hypothetical protein